MVSQTAHIIEIQYFPCIRFFALLCQEELWIEQHENYQKRSLRSKCQLLDANGQLTLTIPLQKGKHERQPIKHTRISYAQDWRRQHLQAIQSAYARSPYFDDYGPAIRSLLARRCPGLFEWNLEIINTIIDLLHLDAQVRLTASYLPGERYAMDWRDHARSPSRPIPAWRTYPQVFSDRHPFAPNLSILDLLFCLGPQARLYLQEVSCY